MKSGVRLWSWPCGLVARGRSALPAVSRGRKGAQQLGTTHGHERVPALRDRCFINGVACEPEQLVDQRHHGRRFPGEQLGAGTR
jgi:hypothetical protein